MPESTHITVLRTFLSRRKACCVSRFRLLVRLLSPRDAADYMVSQEILARAALNIGLQHLLRCRRTAVGVGLRCRRSALTRLCMRANVRPAHVRYFNC